MSSCIRLYITLPETNIAYLPNILENTPLWRLFWTWVTQHFRWRLQPFLLRRQYCEGSNNTRKMVVNRRENLFLVTCRWLWYFFWLFFFVDENSFGWLLPFLLHFLRLWKDEHISHSHLFPHLCIEFFPLVLCLTSDFVSYALHRRCDLSKKFRSSRLLPPFQFWPTFGFWSSCLGQHAAGRAESYGCFSFGQKREFLQDFWNIKNGSPQKTTGPELAKIPGLPCFWGLQFQDYNVNCHNPCFFSKFHDYHGNTSKTSDRQPRT